MLSVDLDISQWIINWNIMKLCWTNIYIIKIKIIYEKFVTRLIISKKNIIINIISHINYMKNKFMIRW